MLSLVDNKKEYEEKVTFDQLWRIYPRKVSKFAASKLWEKMDAAERRAALDALPRHIEHWRNSCESIQFVPHCRTWLYQRRWEDELDCALPESIPCRWTGCKLVGMHAWGAAHYCEAHLGRLKRGETP